MQNSFEAVDPEKPHVRISSKGVDEESPLLQIEIFSTGIPPCPQDMGDILVPFYSSKPYGTGFGLVIGIALVLFLEHLLLRKGGAKPTS